MKKILAILRLFRWYNLLMIGLIMYFFRGFVVQPLIREAGFELALSGGDFFLLVLSVVLMTAAGYVINDYFDLRIDRINKPGRVVIGKQVSRRSAIILHLGLNGISILIGIYLSWRIQYWPLAPIMALVPLLLWVYSFWLKRSFLVGNFAVASLAGLLIPLVWIVDYQAAGFARFYELNLKPVEFFIWFYSLFSFFTTFVREIVKDIQDFAGDQVAGCKTLVVVIGLERTRKILLALLILLIVSLATYSVVSAISTRVFLAAYFLIGIIIPLSAAAFFANKALVSRDYERIQYLLKLAMLTGVLSMVIQYLYIGR